MATQSGQIHFDPVTRGVLDSRDVLYYLSFIFFFLAVNVHLVRRDRPPAVNLLLLAGILVLVNDLARHRSVRASRASTERSPTRRRSIPRSGCLRGRSRSVA